MKKKLLAFLVCVCLALGTFTSVSAFAGVNLNSPTGTTGLISGGGINSDNFVLKDDADPSAYRYSAGNTTYSLKGVTGVHNVSIRDPFPYADVTQGSKFVMQIDIHDFGANGNTSLFTLNPFYDGIDSTSGGTVNNYNNTLSAVVFIPGVDNTQIHMVRGAAAPNGATYWLPDEGEENGYKNVTPTSGVTVAEFGFQTDMLTKQKEKGHDYVTFWFEFNVNEEKSMTIFAGYDDGTTENLEKVEYGTIKNAFTMPKDATLAWMWQPYCELEFDNYKLYRIDSTEEKKEYISIGFEKGEEDKFTNALSGPGQATDGVGWAGYRGKLTINPAGEQKVKSEITVTNPAADARIVSKARLAVDDSLDETFVMNAGMKIDSYGENSTRKAGIVFGLNDEDDKITAPSKGASLVYLTVKKEESAQKVYLGAVNIAPDGTQTQIGEEVLLEGVTVGGDYVQLELIGKKDGSVDVKVNGAETPVNFAGIKASGVVGFAHIGEGNFGYKIYSQFSVTGYRYAENETEERISTTFEGGWIPSYKFNENSTVSQHGGAVEGGHPAVGMEVEDGKLGFFGTGTGTRLLTKKEYADFVMQFDYISMPYGERGEANGDRYSGLFVMFGAAGSGLLGESYAFTIKEGNYSDFHGTAESLITTGDATKPGKNLDGSTLSNWSAMNPQPEEGAVPEDAQLVQKATGIEYYQFADEASKTKTLYNQTTRFKLVVSNNNVALFAARVTNGVVGAYNKVGSGTVSDSFGYVGFGTDEPAWCMVDNVCITPLGREVVLGEGNTVDTIAADSAYEVDPADMDADPEPTALPRPELTADVANKKVTWAAVEGAAEYEVTVSYEGTKKETVTITATEFSMAEYEDEGEYEVAVQAIPEDANRFFPSRSTVKYVIGSSTTPGGDDNKPGDGDNTPGTNKPEEKGCGCGSTASAAAGGAAAVLLLAGACVLSVRRRKA